MRFYLHLPILLGMIWWHSWAWALDHDNLDRSRPLQIEDAYPIAKGEIGIEGGGLYRDSKHEASEWTPRLQILYGLLYNTQIEIGGSFVKDHHPIGPSERFWNLSVGGLYNFNTETMTLPAMAVKLELEFPTGDDLGKMDATLAGLLTHTWGRWRTHLNVEYTLMGSAQTGERNGVYRVTGGLSYPLGYPMRFRETFIVDVFTHPSERSGEDPIAGIEMGLRHQLSQRVVLDGGIGTEFMGPSNRSRILGTVGLSLGF
jgi:hypothetical protein